MIERLYLQSLRSKLAKFPAVALLGPRQCGKTTLAQKLAGRYFDMESPGSQIQLDAQWDQLTQGAELLVLDEAHLAPAIFSRLRSTIDADRKRNGRFLLLGSVSPELMENVSESLAGRLGLLPMTPLILPELPASELDRLWLCGGYPDGGILAPEMFPEWQVDYLQILAARDLPTWGMNAKPALTERLLAIIAALQGQPLNASQLGTALGLDHKTVLTYCDFLQGAFLIRRLPPYFANLSKRLVKTPRVFWRDSGLLHAILNISTLEQLYRQPWVGHSWEGFVIEETLATLAALGQRAKAFYFRTSDGYELDLVLDWGDQRWAIEVKLTSSPTPEMIARLHKSADLIGASRRILICRIAEPIQSPTLLVTDLNHWLKIITRP